MNFNFNEHTIVLPDLAFESTKFTMGNDSSYAEKFIKRYRSSKHYRNVLLPLKLQCLFNVKKYLGDSYDSYLDLLAGIGISSRIFDTDYNELNDFSGECYAILKENFKSPNDTLYNIDMYHYNFNRFDFIFLDFNNNTLKKSLNEYKPVIDNAFASANKYILINDCSVTYLKYGESSYKNYAKLLGVTSEELKINYYSIIKQHYKKLYPTWSLTHIETHPQTSFLLFEKQEPEYFFFNELKININSEVLNIKTSLTDEG